jgi:tetratricopeptide (TPR) repeat protein
MQSSAVRYPMSTKVATSVAVLWISLGAIVLGGCRKRDAPRVFGGFAAATASAANAFGAAREVREVRTGPSIEPTPAPVPTALPLVGGDGKLPDGYPIAYVDATALRSLLYQSRFSDLDRYFGQLQDAFEVDDKREYWIQDAADAFGSTEPALAPLLGAWVAASRGSFASYLARAAHRVGMGWKRKGERSAYQARAMRAEFNAAIVDLDKSLSVRPKLVAARQLRLLALAGLGAPSSVLRAEVDRATQVCPGCFRIRATYLLNTTPRQGGTYDQMHSFAATCDPAVNARCRLLDGYADLDRADIASTNKQLVEAEEAIDRAIALGDCAPFLVERSFIRRARANYEGALTDADRALALWHSGGGLVARANALLGMRRFEPAAQALLEAVRLDPSDVRARELAAHAVRGLLVQAVENAKAGRDDDTRRAIDLAAELAPSDPEVISLRAATTQGGNEADTRALEAAAAKSPDDLRLHQELGQALLGGSDFTRAESMWTDYIAHHPREGRAYFERAALLRELGKQEEARDDAARACAFGIDEACLPP